MNIVIVAQQCCGFDGLAAVVEIQRTPAGSDFPFEIWWRPDSYRLQPALCSRRRTRAHAYEDMNWIAGNT